MTSTDTPRTDACPHCGAEKRPYSIAIREYNCETLIGKIDGAIQRSELCREREARHKTEAEIERLKKLCEMALESAEDAVEERDLKRRIADDICSLRKDLNR
jgi:hypothetical protein